MKRALRTVRIGALTMILAPGLAGLPGVVGRAGLACFVGIAGLATGATVQIDQREDLFHLREWVELEQSFDADARTEAQRRIARWLESDDRPDEVEFYLRIASVTALADNGHSNVSLAPVYGFGLLPIRTYWFSDGLYVVRSRAEYSDLLGARIETLAGRPVKDVAATLGVYHGGTAEHFRQYYSTPLMISPPVLHAAGLSAREGRVTLGVVLADGSRLQIELAIDGHTSRATRTSPWRTLLPAPVGSIGDEWETLHDAGTEMPLAMQEPDELFRYVHLEDQGIVYIQLRANIGSGGQSIREFAAQARARIESDRPTAIILDNRFNPGGDLTRTADFALDLPSLVPADGRVYVLTSNATFSAGIYTSFYPKAADPEKTVVLGERVGDRERFWAETGRPFILPETKYRLSYSLQMHDLGPGCPDPQVCHLSGRGRWNIGVGSLDPDVQVPTTFEDYAAGRDPVMSYVLGLRSITE